MIWSKVGGVVLILAGVVSIGMFVGQPKWRSHYPNPVVISGVPREPAPSPSGIWSFAKLGFGVALIAAGSKQFQK